MPLYPKSYITHLYSIDSINLALHYDTHLYSIDSINLALHYDTHLYSIDSINLALHCVRHIPLKAIATRSLAVVAILCADRPFLAIVFERGASETWFGVWGLGFGV